jgi:hypothetical protein
MPKARQSNPCDPAAWLPAASTWTYNLLFTHWPSLLPEYLAAEQIFYNRYYWFRRFASLYQKKNGFDAGIEQQADQLIEYAGSALDWTVVEQIDAQVRKEIEGDA